MPLTDIVRFAVASIATGVLAWAALSDVRTRRIPNASVLALLALFVAWTLADGGAGLVSALEAGAIALVVILIPTLVAMMLFIHHQYRASAAELEVRPDKVIRGPHREERVVVPVAGINRAVVQAVNVG